MMRRHLFGAALALAGVGCDPIQLVVKEPVVERVLVVPDQAGAHGRREGAFGIYEASDMVGPARSALGRVLTADTDPARMEGGTISAGAGTFPCVLPGAPAAWCAKAVSGPFVVTDLETSAGCGAHVIVAALTSRMAETPRWSLRGALAAHGGRLALRHDELLFITAVIAAPPPPPAPSAKKAGKHSADPPPPEEPEPQHCSVTWAGFHPYTPEEARADFGSRRPIDRTLDVPPMGADALDPTPPLGAQRKPRIIFHKLDTSAPTAPLPGSPMDPGF